VPGAGRRLAWGSLAAAAIGLGLLWRLLPAGSPPVYDGVCIADPYRFLGHTPAPSSATKDYPGSSFPTAEVLTGETPAQAQILMMAGSFSASSTITVSITPEPPPAPPPSGMTQDGNAYRFAATSAGQSLQPSSQSPVTVVLRGTGASSALTMEVHSTAGWQPLRTFNLGCGYTFEAVSPTLGDFALFHASSGGGSGGSSSGGFPVAAIVGILAVIVVGATLGLARISARRRQ
jgi:hypothetical protein